MKKNNLVSIIVPVYNIENFIEKCIKSLCEQTYQNLEILLIDDGSKDKSGYLCDTMGKKDNRIKVFHKKNTGLSDARNYGIKNASGKYLLFIDGDDTISKDMVEVLYVKITDNEADISACPFIYEYSDGSTKNYEKIVRDCDYIMSNEEAVELLINKKYAFRHIACNKMYKASLFGDVLFPVGKLYEDMGTVYKLISKAKKIVYTYNTYYYYYQRSNSITKTFVFKNNEVDRIEMANDMYFDLLKLFPKLHDKLICFRITQYIAVVNVMIKSKTYDTSIIKETKELIRKNIVSILKNASLKEKAQAIGLGVSFNFYKIVFKLTKGR